VDKPDGDSEQYAVSRLKQISLKGETRLFLELEFGRNDPMAKHIEKNLQRYFCL
jgi:hypothetical protein